MERGWIRIPKEHILCNDFVFEDDRVVGASGPMTVNGGKKDVIRDLKKTFDVVWMVGDGATDLETK